MESSEAPVPKRTAETSDPVNDLGILGSISLRIEEQNARKIAAIYETYFGARRSNMTVEDLNRIPYGTLKDPSKLEGELLNLKPSSILVSAIDYIQKVAQYIGLAATNGQLRCLTTITSKSRIFSFECSEQYIEIRKACARRDARARANRFFDRLKNLTIACASKLFLPVMSGIVSGVIVLLVSRC